MTVWVVYDFEFSAGHFRKLKLIKCSHLYLKQLEINSPFEQGVDYIESSRLSITLRMQNQMRWFLLRTRVNE